MKEIQERNRKKIIIFIMIICFIMLLIVKQIREIKNRKEEMPNSQYNAENVGATYNYQKWNGEESNNDIQNNNDYTSNNSNENEELLAKEKIIEEQSNKILDEYKGYKVSAKLEIPKINLETYILKQYSTQALNMSVTKFWGAEPNTVGNFCIAGHNFQNKNMFHNLRRLNKGDKLTISDNNVGEVRYEIYDIYEVKPEEVSCLSQRTNGKREATLITCTLDSAKRIIVKAREIN